MEPIIAQETLFNAGVDIALNISKLFKEAEYYASSGHWPMWFIKLEALERRMWTKIKVNKEAKEEFEDLKKLYMPRYRKFLKRYDKEKRISNGLNDDVKIFLSEYEKALVYWRDKFGYGMPMKDDSRYALG